MKTRSPVWTKPEWEARLRALHAQGLLDKQSAAQLGVCVGTVHKARKALRLPSNAGMGGPALRALKAEARLGHCVGCDGPLGRYQRLCCGEEECGELLYRAYLADKPAGARLRPVVGCEVLGRLCFRLTLECGHVVLRQGHQSKRRPRARCEACAQPEAERRAA